MYSIDERETIIQMDDVSQEWNVYTRQRKIITKLKKSGYMPFNEELEDGVVVACEFTLPSNKISFRNANTTKREMSDEQRAAAAERLRNARLNK